MSRQMQINQSQTHQTIEIACCVLQCAALNVMRKDRGQHFVLSAHQDRSVNSEGTVPVSWLLFNILSCVQ